MPSLLDLLLGTLLLRPYVFCFLAVYLVAAPPHIGWKRTLAYIPLGYGLAWLSEFSSINWGFPYGDYFYIPATIDRELWVFGVPFFDSLSYVFLSYCSYSMAIFLLSPVLFRPTDVFILETRRLRRGWHTLTLGAFLFVLLDIIIDPVAFQGSRWFLGQIYGYKHVGLYFGIPMSNFGGWLLVGFVLIGTLQLLDHISRLEPQRESILQSVPCIGLLGPILYVSVLIFNLIVTLRIGEHLMGIVGSLILLYPLIFGIFFTLYKQANITRELITLHIKDFPSSRAALLASGTPREHAGSLDFKQVGIDHVQKSGEHQA